VSNISFGFGQLDGDDWLESHLFDRRVIVIRGPLDNDSATRAASKLMTLDATGDDVVNLHLDSNGGPLEAAFAVVDVIDALGVPVHVTCLGRVAGTAVAIAVACTRRSAMPHARFRLSDPDVAFEAHARQIESLVDNHKQALRNYHGRLAEATAHTVAEIEEACRAGRWMDAEAAVAYGLLDEITSPRRATVRDIRDQRGPGLTRGSA
jgi:ATP-dependent Clp protease protease subunit